MTFTRLKWRELYAKKRGQTQAAAFDHFAPIGL
jgi:hypothetical protein